VPGGGTEGWLARVQEVTALLGGAGLAAQAGMTLTTRALLVAALAAVAACGDGDRDAADGDQDAADRPIEPDGADDVAPACVLGDRPFVVASQAIEGRVLRLQVAYAGGCAEHAFEVWWSGVIAPSDPPIVPLEVQHHGNGDECSDAIEDEVAIDLTELDAVAGGGPVRVQIVVGEGGTDTLLEVLYSPPGEPTDVPAMALPIDLDCGTIGA
jgi:hypothetical protein